jgi:ferredoxin
VIRFLPPILLAAAAFSIAGLCVWFAVVSYRERETRAARTALLCSLAALPLAALVFAGLRLQTTALVLLAALLLAGIGIFFLPVRRINKTLPLPGKQINERTIDERTIDERTIMFARMRLEPGSERFEAYYALHPEHRAVDDRIRRLPGLLAPNSPLTNPLLNAAAEASFSTVAQLGALAEGPPAAERIPLDPAAASAYVLALARHYGALDAGITRLQPYHIYSHIGRGPGEWGAVIDLPHTYAIAFTVEMALENIQPAPRQPVTLESARQYLNAGAAAVQLAEALRRMGYNARAHIDGNYRVICPLVARDAGLGEIGRMGLLLTPRQGPRVRIGVVTTDLELLPHSYQPDESVFDFCTICKKCVENCPSHSIPTGERTEINSVLRWQIDQAACYEYWARIGTDCARCLAVCPYAHADHWLHNRIRDGIRRSPAFRRAALWADDLFYGRHPAPKMPPRWTAIP